MAKDLVIGIDIGGQSAKYGVVNMAGEVLAQDTWKTAVPPTEAQVYVNTLAEALKDLLVKSGISAERIHGIGVGAPNGNYYNGNIECAPNLPWAHDRVPFAKMLSEATGLPVKLTNDANAAALGEMKYGVAQGMRDFIMITLGTGVGSGIVIDGKVVYGHDGFAGELGHTVAIPGGRPCNCGKKGCVEAYCSAIGVARTAREWLEENPGEASLLRGKENISSKDVYDAAKQGDALAIRVFEFTGKILGTKLADFIAFSAPEAIILFGGLAHSREFLTKPVVEAMNEEVLSLWKGKVKLLYSGLNEADAAILGASALGWEADA